MPTLDSKDIPVLRVSFKDGFKVNLQYYSIGHALSSQCPAHLWTFEQDYYGGYKSLIGYDWNFSSRRNRVKPTIYFSENEIGKLVSISSMKQSNK